MEKKRVKRYIYEGLGFPVVLVNVSLVKKRGIWTPAVDYNKLQKEALLALTHKTTPLTGHELHFIRTYFEMTLDKFGKQFGVSHAAVVAWEKKGDKPAKINPSTELFIRLMVLEKLNTNNQVFREAFREFDIVEIAKPSFKAIKPITLTGPNVSKRSHSYA